MVIQSATFTINSLGLSFSLGDEKVIRFSITQGARDRSSNASITLVDEDLAISGKIFAWSKANGGIKIPQDLRGSRITSGSSTPPTPSEPGSRSDSPGTGDNGSKLEGLEDEPIDVSVYMDVIAWCEGTYPDGYNVMFTHKTFTDFSDHPRQIQGSGSLRSDAAGRYQFLSTTWDSVARSLGLTDFTPRSQNIAGWQLAKNRGVTAAGIQSNPLAEYKRAAQEWASLPGSPYGQPTKTDSEVTAKHAEFLEKRRSKELTTNIPANNPNDGSGGGEYYPSGFSNSVKAALDLIAYSQGTFEDDSYNLNLPRGRYLLTLESIAAYKEAGNDYDNNPSREQQDNAVVWVIKNEIEGNPYQDLAGGQIENFILDVRSYWQTLPGGSNEVLTMSEALKFYQERLEYWNELEPPRVIDGDESADTTGTVDNRGERVTIVVFTENGGRYQYNFILTGITTEDFPIPEISINCQSIKYSMSQSNDSENFEEVNPIDVFYAIAAKYNKQLNDRTLTPERLTPITELQQNNRNDFELLQDLADENGLIITENLEEETIEVTEESNRPTKRIDAEPILSLKFEDRAVVDEKPLYPVLISAITNDSYLALKPEDKITLDNLYEFIPLEIKTVSENWIVISITHDLVNFESTLELMTYLPIEEEAVTEGGGSGTTVGSGGLLTLEQVTEKYKPAITKTGGSASAYASGFLISQDGWLLTAAHMTGKTSYNELPDGTNLGSAREVEIDRGADVMLCKIETSGQPICLMDTDMGNFEDGSNMVTYAIGHPVAAKMPNGGGGQGGGARGQIDWHAAESTVIELRNRGTGTVQKTPVVVADIKGGEYVINGKSGCPHFNNWGLVYTLTSGGNDRTESWSPALKYLLEVIQKHNVPITSGSRTIAISEGEGTGSSEPGDIVYWLENLSKGTLARVGQTIEGFAVTSNFGNRTHPTTGESNKLHTGVDIARPNGSPLYAPSKCEVEGGFQSGYGNYAVVQFSGSSKEVFFAHLQSSVKSGGYERGQIFARTNNTGSSTGPHDHIEIGNKGFTGFGSSGGSANLYEPIVEVIRLFYVQQA